MIGRVIAAILLSFVGLVGLGMSLCGGLFTLSGLFDSSSGGGEMHASGFLPVSVPSLLVGVAIVYGVISGFRRLERRRGEPPRDAAPAAPPDEQR